MTVTVRPATRADLPAIKALMREFADYLNAIADWQDVDDSHFDRVEPHVFGPHGFCGLLVAEAAGDVAGYLMHHRGVDMDTLHEALHVTDLFVRAAQRKRGVGRALMDAAAAIVRSRGGSTLYWTVWDQNPQALAFYERLGARRFADEILMRWDRGAR